jgi:hypothetical protein
MAVFSAAQVVTDKTWKVWTFMKSIKKFKLREECKFWVHDKLS